jgi:electron transfer flavoprotein beta subunit
VGFAVVFDDLAGLAGLGVSADQVGLAGAWSVVDAAAARPPKAKGTIVADDGNGGVAIADFLSAQKFI